MDVSNDDDVKKAAAVATDVTLLINNAGVNHNTGFMTAPDLSIATREIEANYLGPLRVTRAFAPALIANHGAVLNMLTILSRVNLPLMASYCASKAAALSLTQGFCAANSRRKDSLRCRGAARCGRYADDRGASDSEDDDGRCRDRDPRWFRGRGRGNLCRRVARGIAQGLAHDPKAVERQLASPG